MFIGFFKSNKKRTAIIISLVLIILGVVPLIIFTFAADLKHPYSIKQIQLKSKDGTRLDALIFRPLDDSKIDSGIVIGHGFCGNKEYMQPLSIELVKRGFIVISIDFRGHGSSDGYLPARLTEKQADELMGDMMAAVEYLENMDRIDKIGLVGHSMGGRTSLNVAEHNPSKIDAVVSIGMISIDYNFTRIHNLLMAIGKYEQIFSETDALEFLQEYTGKKSVEINTQYGEFEDGDACKAIIGPMAEHLLEPLDQKIVYETVQWFESAFNGKRASDVVLTLPYHQLSFLIALIGVVSFIFVIILYIRNYLWKETLERPEKELLKDTSLLESIFLYIIASGIGGILLFPLSLIFTAVLPVSMGNMLYGVMVGNAIGIIVVYYIFVQKRKEKQILAVLQIELVKMCAHTPNRSIFYGIIAAILATSAITSIMHWSTTTTILTAREVGTVIGLTILFFPFLLVKEFYFRAVQGRLKATNRVREYFSMVGIGILIDNLLLIVLMISIWQNSNSTIAFYALALTVVVIFSVIQQFMVTWVYMYSGRNILGSAIFLSIFYGWMIVNFFPFGLN